jgi:LPS-assembly protein
VNHRLLLILFLCLIAGRAAAQPAPAPQPAPASPAAQRNLLELLSSGQWKLEQLSRTHFRLSGDVEWEPPGSGLKFSGDQIELFTDTGKVVATGNVVFSNPEGRIAAERVEFDLNSNVGTFHQASGIMSLGPGVDRAQFGNQDPDVYFYGDVIEKISARQYKITRGGFSTCVQPTPRWEVTSKSVTINLDEYAIARNMVLRVKGVPLMYLPLIYYPIQNDERATGFLMPTYGASTLRGQAISNAFFWAINRSQDATLFHDWYTRAGQGVGGEYRYISNAGSYGTARMYRFSQDNATYTEDGTVTTVPESTSYKVMASMTQTLTPNIRARARIDYFTNIVTQQLYQQNVAYSTQPYRVIEGGISAGIGRVSTSVQYLRNELFSSSTSSFVYGSTPRVQASVAPQTLFGRQVYGSASAEYAYLPYRNITSGEITLDRSLGRVDLAPQVRVPLSRLTFLSVNTSATSRTTYYTRSLAADGTTMVPEGLVRQFLTTRTDVIGPVLTKIWDTPDSASRERMKHVIEPVFSLDYTTNIDNQSSVPILSDVSDVVIGGTTRFTYGLYNRLFYRSRPRDGRASTTREFVTIGVQQTYYSEPLASRYDTTYVSTSGRPNLVDLSPVALTARVSPTGTLDANARMEYDVSGNGLQIFSTSATANLIAEAPEGGVSPRQASVNVGYSWARPFPTQPISQYLSLSTNSRWLDGRVGATYGLSWDIERAYIQSQSVMMSYMAQCCGIQADFQTVNFLNNPAFPVSSDRRFNFSLVLAGLGTFSNFFGAFGQR